jgi:glutathione transport system ATP-binding protein
MWLSLGNGGGGSQVYSGAARQRNPCYLDAIMHAHMSASTPLLAIDGLTVEFRTAERSVTAVRDLSLTIGHGETVAVVGESGSGKSVTALSVMRLVEHGGGRITAGSIRFERPEHGTVDLVTASARTMRQIRGGEIAMIFQEPMTSLNPVFPVGDQIAEAIVLHQEKSAGASRAEALRMLEQVRIPDARAVMARYPHQLSGGMRQRVMIAMALSCRPSLLIADEPTTALDVTIQAQILSLIRVLQDEMRMAVMFITHDMGVVAEVADRVAVMLAGEKVEEGSAEDIFARPLEPYTRNLLAAVPRLGALANEDGPRKLAIAGAAATSEPPPPAARPILKVRDLTTRFDVKAGVLSRTRRRVYAVERVSFDLGPAETLALVGESGCGKSTTGRSLLRLVEPAAGSIEFDGRDIA